MATTLPRQHRTVERAPRSAVRRAARRLAEAGGVGLAAILGAVALYRPWGWRASVPFSTQFDNQLNAIFVKNLLGGSVYTTDRLGAPFAQHLQDFPVGDNRWSFLVVRAIGLFDRQPYSVLNLFFLLGFGLVAAAAYLAARELGLRALPATVVAWLFAFLPFHFAHDETHVWLANYAGQPLAVLLAVWVLRGQLRLPVIGRDSGAWTRDQRRRLAVALCCVVYLGGGGGYYAAFSIFAVFAAGLLAQARRRSWRSAATGAIVAAGILAVLLANLAPELIWRVTHGVDHSVAQRSLSDNRRFGLDLTQMVLPGPAHRLSFLAAIGRRANPNPFSGSGGQQVGIVALLGLLSCWWALLRRGVSRRADDPDGLLPLPVALGVVAAFLVLLGTIDGLGYLIAVGGITQFRAWSRLVVQIAFCGLLGLAWQLDRYRRARLEGSRRLAVGAAALILVVGLLDQIPVGFRPHYTSTRTALESTRGFVSSMQAALPDGAMVFQYPVTTFPEAGPTRAMPDYSLAVPYILGDGTLRYSYGGIRGRESGWQGWWAQQPMPQQLRGLAAAGFDAVTVDRRAYLARGAAFERSLAAELGPPAGTSRDGDQSWFDLRPLRASMARDLPQAEIAEAGRLITSGIEPSFSGDVGPNRAASDRQDRWIGAAVVSPSRTRSARPGTPPST